jgi:hypothetical protein
MIVALAAERLVSFAFLELFAERPVGDYAAQGRMPLEGRMSNLEITQILAISIIGIAVAQALTILLTIRRERDVKEVPNLSMSSGYGSSS